jgi:excisionase family DNA binding protein
VTNDEHDPPVLPLTEAARRLGLSRSTAYTLAADGTFPVPVLRPSPRRMVVSTAALNAYIEGTG